MNYIHLMLCHAIFSFIAITNVINSVTYFGTLSLGIEIVCAVIFNYCGDLFWFTCPIWSPPPKKKKKKREIFAEKNMMATLEGVPIRLIAKIHT